MKQFLFLILVLGTMHAYPQDIKKRYNLGFETTFDGKSDNWQLIADDYQVKFDTINKVEGKRSLVFSKKYLASDFSLCLYQKILLPKPSDQIAVSLFSKNLDHQYAWLKIAGFDKSGKIIVTDSLSILSDTGWKQFTAQISHKNVYLLSIEIRTKIHNQEDKKEVKLWIDNVSVSCDGKDLLSFNTPSNDPSETEIAAIKNNIPLNKDMVLPENILNEIAKKKIIGFGETAHGNLETEKCKFNNIKQLISKHNCRLVLFEIPIDLVAQYNLFVHGYEIDSTYCSLYPGCTKIDTTYRKLYFFSPELKKFVTWVKDYNALHKDKVNLMGIDEHTTPFSSNQTPPEINRFISSMKLRSDIIDSLMSKINSRNYRRIPLQYAVKNEKQLTNLMGEFNCMVLLQILKSRTDSALFTPQYRSWSEWQFAHRDHILWQNTKQVLENFTDGKSPVVICAHYAHMDKVSTVHFNEVTSLGQYISKVYGNDYCHIGILLDQGAAGAMYGQFNRKLGYQKLQKPIKGSLEYLASLSNQECFYKQEFIESKVPLMIRRLGENNSDYQFVSAYFPGSMDGFIYIRNSTPSFKL